ncbi:hypothetical protein [Streptomyces lunalinharesii]|uniref:hypothetical protein n=1 Tax=Streptomyces lunalinharesii TaxID=333384 RepID=UPI0031D33D9C
MGQHERRAPALREPRGRDTPRSRPHRAAQARGASWWRGTLRLLPYGFPILYLLQLAMLLGLLMNRSGTLEQAAYAWPALAVCATVGAVAATAVVVARLLALGTYRWRR